MNTGPDSGTPGADKRDTPQRDLRRPNCPLCGAVLLIAEQTAFNAIGSICHTWTCDGCDFEFATSIRVWSQ